MKKIILFTVIVFVISCSKNEELEAVNSNPHNLQNLGLSASNNIYPFWPDTYQYLGSNQWFDYKHGDTLIVTRRDAVSDDSGDEIEYRFLVKNCNWILPLNIKRIHCDASSGVPCFAVYNKQIINFRLQQYTANEILACEIETPNGNGINLSLIDRMWINLAD